MDAASPVPRRTISNPSRSKYFGCRRKIGISSVEIDGDAVKITCSGDLPASGVTVGYAMTTHAAAPTNGFYAWGQLRDSDPFVGWVTKAAQPNYAVAFELPVP